MKIIITANGWLTSLNKKLRPEMVKEVFSLAKQKNHLIRIKGEHWSEKD